MQASAACELERERRILQCQLRSANVPFKTRPAPWAGKAPPDKATHTYISAVLRFSCCFMLGRQALRCHANQTPAVQMNHCPHRRLSSFAKHANGSTACMQVEACRTASACLIVFDGANHLHKKQWVGQEIIPLPQASLSCLCFPTFFHKVLFKDLH